MLIDRHRDEARRLLSLSDEEQQVELLASFLSTQEQQRLADDELARLDRECLSAILDDQGEVAVGIPDSEI